MLGKMRAPLAAAIAFALLFALGIALTSQSPMPVQAQNVACFHAQGGALFACDSGGTIELRAGSTISIDTFLTLEPQDNLNLTMNGEIVPTGSFQPIQSAGAVGISGDDIAAGEDGDVLVLFNAGANTITITETTGLVSAGNIALGALDAATLVYSGTTWIQIGASNN